MEIKGTVVRAGSKFRPAISLENVYFLDIPVTTIDEADMRLGFLKRNFNGIVSDAWEERMMIADGWLN